MGGAWGSDVLVGIVLSGYMWGPRFPHPGNRDEASVSRDWGAGQPPHGTEGGLAWNLGSGPESRRAGTVARNGDSFGVGVARSHFLRLPLGLAAMTTSSPRCPDPFLRAPPRVLPACARTLDAGEAGLLSSPHTPSVPSAPLPRLPRRRLPSSRLLAALLAVSL